MTRSAVRICPAAPESVHPSRMNRFFLSGAELPTSAPKALFNPCSGCWLQSSRHPAVRICPTAPKSVYPIGMNRFFICLDSNCRPHLHLISKMFTIPFPGVHSSDTISPYTHNQGFTQSTLSSLFLFFLQTKARGRKPRAFVCLFRVVEFKIVDADSIAVFDALFLQTVEQAALAELAVEIHAGLIIVEVDVVQKLLEPLS